MSAVIFEQEIIAQASDIDALGHVNNAIWVRWIQDVATGHWQRDARPQDQADYLWVVTRHEVDYLRNVEAGQKVLARSWIAGPPRGARSTRIIEFTDAAGRMCVRAETQWAIIQIATGRPIRVPAEVIAPFL